MKTLKHIFKTGVAVAFAAAVGFGCNYDRPESNPTDDVSTSKAIVEMDSSTANLNTPRPAPIGDTSETAEQANYLGEMAPNQDSAARAMHKLDEIKKRKQNQ